MLFLIFLRPIELIIKLKIEIDSAAKIIIQELTHPQVTALEKCLTPIIPRMSPTTDKIPEISDKTDNFAILGLCPFVSVLFILNSAEKDNYLHSSFSLDKAVRFS